MFRPLLICIVLTAFLGLVLEPGLSPAQLIDTIGSEHILLRMPTERESLGREVTAEIEQCYLYMNRATNHSLPKKIAIIVSWDQAENSCDHRTGTITLGMGNPAAASEMRGYLLHSAGREIARLGLLALSGGARREDTEFLFEGMIEILVHEYDRTSRSIEGAWVISSYLDQMKQLGVATQRSWTTFSSGKRCLRSAAPGITLLTTYREMQGRETPLKLFELLKKNSLAASLSAAFKVPAAEIENSWLKRVREYQIPEEITIKGDEVPQLQHTVLIPGMAKPGTKIEMQLVLRDRRNNLFPDGVFVRDERTGRITQAEASANFMTATLPVDSDCPPGEYRYQITAIDESGNLRHWSGNYKVGN